MLRPVRRRLAALAVVALVPALGGCGIAGFAGSEYQTDQVYQPGVGVNDKSGTVDVLGAVVVTSSEGEGTLVASFVNQDRSETAALTEVTGDGFETQLTEPVELRAQNLVNLADTGAISVTGEDIVPGKFVRLTLAFDSGQKTPMNIPVVSNDAEYADITPAEPSGSPSSSPQASPSEAPSS
jgi:hypothetical protein